MLAREVGTREETCRQECVQPRDACREAAKAWQPPAWKLIHARARACAEARRDRVLIMSDLFPTSMMTTSLPRSARTSSIHFDLRVTID